MASGSSAVPEQCPTRALRPRPGNLTASLRSPLCPLVALTGGAGWARPGSSGSRLRGSPCLPEAPPGPVPRSVYRARQNNTLEDKEVRSLRGPRCAVGRGVGGRWLTRQRGRRRGGSRLRAGAGHTEQTFRPHPPHQEGAALSPGLSVAQKGGLSSGGDLARGFEDCPQPTFPRTPLSRDPGAAWGWGWEGVRSGPLYIRGPRPSRGRPAQRICPRRDDGAGEGCRWGLDLKSVCFFPPGFGPRAGEEGRSKRFKKLALMSLLSRTL